MMSSRFRSLVLAAGVLLLPSLASAQGRRGGPYYDGPGDQGLILGARVGYAFPAGDLASPNFASPPGSLALSDFADSKIPIWLEVGYRFSPVVWGTLYLELAPVNVNSSVCGGADCSGSDVRFGVDVQLHPMPYQPIDPWLGLGIGAEWLSFKNIPDATGILGDDRYSGWEFPLLEGGLDFNVNPRFALGPYAAISFARFNSYRRTQQGFSTTTDIGGDERTHEWFQLGFKATIKM